jgi:integrase
MPRIQCTTDEPDCVNVCEICRSRTHGEHCRTCTAWIDVALRVVSNAAKDGASSDDVRRADPSLDEFETLASPCVEHLCDLGRIVERGGRFFLPNMLESKPIVHESAVEPLQHGPVDRRERCRVHSWRFLTDAGYCAECRSERRERNERERMERAVERKQRAPARHKESERNERERMKRATERKQRALARREESERDERERKERLRAVAERAARLVEQGTCTNTQRSYAASWEQWESFCRANGREPLSCTQDEAVSLLLDWIDALRKQDLSVATIKNRLAGVAAGYSKRGIDIPPADDPRIRKVRSGLEKEAAERGERRKQAKGLTVDDLRKGVSSIRHDLGGLRDRALLLLAFAAKLRLDELCALRRKHVEFCEGGLVLDLGRSKTDQTGEGAKIHVRAQKDDLCPVAAVGDWFRWLDKAADPKGPIFRPVNRAGGIGSSALTVRGAFEIFRSRGKAAGIEGLSGHSARVGAIREASLVGA